MTGPVCPNGHAMDDGLFDCPSCGAYRPSAWGSDAIVKDGRVVGVRRACPWAGRAHPAGCECVMSGFRP